MNAVVEVNRHDVLVVRQNHLGQNDDALPWLFSERFCVHISEQRREENVMMVKVDPLKRVAGMLRD